MRARSFDEFWPYYLRQHSKPGTRLVHSIGTALGITGGIVLIAIGKWYLLPLALLATYAILFPSHWWIEHNRPATLSGGPREVLWSIRGDLRMFKRTLTGSLRRDLDRWL